MIKILKIYNFLQTPTVLTATAKWLLLTGHCHKSVKEYYEFVLYNNNNSIMFIYTTLPIGSFYK